MNKKGIVYYRLFSVFLFLFSAGFYTAMWKFIPQRSDAPGLAITSLIVGVYHLIRLYLLIRNKRQIINKQN